MDTPLASAIIESLNLIQTELDERGYYDSDRMLAYTHYQTVEALQQSEELVSPGENESGRPTYKGFEVHGTRNLPTTLILGFNADQLVFSPEALAIAQISTE